MSGAFNSFITVWVDANRKQLTSSYSNFEQFNKKFVVSDALLNEFIAHAETNNKVKPNPEQLQVSRNEILLILKALIAGQIFTTSEYFEVINTSSEVVRRALEVYDNWDKYKHLVKN